MRRLRPRRGIYRRTVEAIYPGGSWCGYTTAHVMLVLECGHHRDHVVPVWNGVSVGVPPLGVWCRACGQDRDAAAALAGGHLD